LQRKVLLCILQSLKIGCWHHSSKVFTSYHPEYLWFFIFRVAEKRFYDPEYNATIHLLDNPDT
jgi:hypothetical protein